MSTTIDIRRADSRPHTSISWLDSRHSFSFGPHYDPSNVGHGLLLVSNDDRVRGRQSASPPTRTRTWRSSPGCSPADCSTRTRRATRGELYPGLAQRMSAGTGIWHSEINPPRGEDVHFVQMWVPPDTEAVDPSYEQLDINGELDKGGLQPIASGQGHDAAISIRQRGAVLWGGRLEPAETVQVPDGRHVHVFVAVGDATLEGAGPLAEGDAARLTGAGSPGAHRRARRAPRCWSG